VAVPGPRIFVTGAGGFVGSILVRSLARKLPAGGVIHAAGYLGDDDCVRAITLDITDAAAIDAAIEETRPDFVMHLAAVSAFQTAKKAPRQAWNVNLTGTINLAESILTHVPDACFVFASTSEAYGEAFNRSLLPLDETAALIPRSLYAATKAAADLALGQMAYDGLRTVRFRPFNHTGPGQGEDFVVPAFAAQIARIEAGLAAPIINVGNLDARRDFLDARDVVAAYEAVLLGTVRPQAGAVFNLCSGEPRRIGDILDQLLALSNVRIDVRVDAARMRPNEVPLVAGDSRLARETIGWRPEIAWETTLSDVLSDFRQQLADQRQN
jgi:nucleoside-diphosphate-sugar epimerase